jgi:hypothetical protein
MFLLNLVREASATQLELLEQRLSEAFPQGSFTLARQTGTPSLIVLTRWGTAVGKGSYSFPEELLVQDRPVELGKAMDRYVIAVQGRNGQA